MNLYKYDPKDNVRTQYKKWCRSDKDFDDVSDEELKENIVKDLSYVSQMDVREYTLYQKFCEVKERYPTVTVNDLWEGERQVLKDEKQRRALVEVKNNIWQPKTNEDYLELEPELIYTGKKEGMPEVWNAIRTFTSTMRNNSNIGRNLAYIIRDRKTKKYLGVICITGDFIDLTPRDKFIGWDRNYKTESGMLNHTAIGSTIVPLQPLGFNYVGGKLLALLCLSEEIQAQWKKNYGDNLVSVTTTSLYGNTKKGGLSQYDNLKYWKPMGFTSGSVSYEPTKKTIYKIRHWLMKNHPRKYFEWYVAKRPNGQQLKRDHRHRSYAFTYSKLGGISKEIMKADHARGVYFCPLYDKSCEYLRGEAKIDELTKAFDNSTEALSELWKYKYAKPRIKQLVKKGRDSKETLFYDDLIYKTWEETKSSYLPQIGR